MVDASRRDFLKANAALLVGVTTSLAGCGEYDPPDPLDPRTATWGMPQADEGNTAANNGTAFPSADVGVNWTAAVTESSGPTPDVPLGVAMDGESVYASYPQGGVAEHDAWTGEVQWRRDGGEPVGPPAILGDQVVVPEAGFALAAYAGSAETPRWTFQGSNLQRVGVDVGDLSIGRSLTVAGEDSLVVAGTDGTAGVVAKLDDQGQPRAATRAVLEEPRPVGPPAVTESFVIVAFESKLVVYDREDLSEVRSTLFDERPVGPPIHHGGRVLVPSETGVAAYDVTPDLSLVDDIEREFRARSSPMRLWRTEVGEGVAGPGARTGQTAIVPTNEGLLAVATTGGNVVWYDREIDPDTPPVVSGGLVYCASTDGRLHVVDAITGSRIAEHAVGGDGWDRLAINGQTVVLTGERSGATSDVTFEGDESESDAGGEGGPRVERRAAAGVDDAAALDGIRTAVLRTVDAIEAKTHVQVFPPVEGDGSDRERELVALVDDLIASYENGEASFETVRGGLERLYWSLRQIELTIGLTHFRRPDPAEVPDGIEAPEATPEIRPEDPQQERLTRNVEAARNALEASETGQTPHSLAPYPPADNEFTPTPVAIGLTEWSLMGRAGRGISRLVVGLAMFVPWLKVGKLLRVVGKALPTPALFRGAGRSIFSVGKRALNLLENARKHSIVAAREGVEEAMESGTLPRIVGRVLVWVLDEAEGAGLTVGVNEGDRQVLSGDGIEFVLEQIDRLFIFLAAVSYEYDVEFHNPEVEDSEAETREEQVRPDLDRTNDSRYDGYTVSQTLDAIAAQDLFDTLVDEDDLPGNRSGAADATKARYREAMGNVARLYRGGQIKYDLIQERAEVEYDVPTMFDARTFAEEQLGLSETEAVVFEVTYNVVTPFTSEELTEVATEVTLQMAAALVESVLNPIGGFAQWMEASGVIDDQLEIAHESGVQQGLYGDHDGTPL